MPAESPLRPWQESLGSLFWILLAACFAWWGRDIPSDSLAGASDPGPAWLPRLAAACLAVGGGLDLARVQWRARRRRASGSNPFATEATDNQVEQTRAAELPSGATQARPPAESRGGWSESALVYAWVICLAAAVPWLGFSLAGILFVAGLLWLSRSAWRWVLIWPVALVLAIQLLFGQLFEVQLPAGLWG